MIMRCLADAAVAAASVHQRKTLDLLARRIDRRRRCGLLGGHPPRCDEGHGRRQAQGRRRDSGSDNTGNFAHGTSIKLPDGAGSNLGVRNHGREERLAGEVELIWICLEGFLEIP